MAVHMRHYIKDTEIYPVNGDLIGLKIDWTEEQGATVNELNVDSIILAREAKQLVLDHIAIGAGVFQGIPYYIDIDGVVIDMYIDLTERPKMSGEGDGSIEVKVKKRKSWEYFKENADALSFEALNKTHTIPLGKTDYVIVRDNQAMILITSLLVTYTLIEATANAIKSLAEGIGEVSEAAVPIVGVGAAGPVVSVNTGAIIWAVAKAIIRLIYLALIVIALIDMINRIIQLVYPRVRQLKSAKVLDLIQTGCAKLGYTFQSSILQGNYAPLTLVPVPLVDNNRSIFQETFLPSFSSGYNKGYPTAQDSTPTLGSLIDAMLDMFNGKILVDNGVVKLERRDFWLNASANNVTNTLNLQGKRENEWTFNTGDSWKRYYIHYQVDHSDTHTMDNYEGTDAEYSTDPITVPHADLVNIKGLSNVNIPFALGNRKGGLNFVEKFVKSLANVMDTFTGGSNSSSISARASAMKISQQYFTTSKLLYQTGRVQGSNYMDLMRASVLWGNFHNINEVNKNFKRIYTAELPFSSQDIVALQGNNYIYDTDSNLLEIISFEWVNQGKKAAIEYAELSNEASNVKTTVING